MACCQANLDKTIGLGKASAKDLSAFSVRSMILYFLHASRLFTQHVYDASLEGARASNVVLLTCVVVSVHFVPSRCFKLETSLSLTSPVHRGTLQPSTGMIAS